MAERKSQVEKRAADVGWSVIKGNFRGYSKNTLTGRAERQAKRRAWGVSRKNKSKRTANRYKRSMIGYLFVGGMILGFIVTWIAYDVVDTEELNFVIFENDAELQEICWSGLRHTKK